jgi:Txe/YoeB family toxin of Txe-Axe toxin-antitoxin module
MRWGVVYYETATGEVPAEEFLDGCPATVDARFAAVLETVRSAPPPQFSGGGYWEAMHGDMGGYYEIRLTGRGRRQHRLFCILDNGSPAELRKRGFAQPQIAVITGMTKNSGAKFSARDYARVRRLGSDYLRQFPRRIAAA